MDSLKIDVYIADLLYRYDCVIVPEFGGFVANYAPARVQSMQHKFIPPSKRISFNKNLTNNDGLLSNHIAERKSIQYEEANALIKDFVGRSLKGLNAGDKIIIEKVGTLFLDNQQNIQFKAEETNDFLLDSFGLNSFRALPVKKETAAEKIQKQLDDNVKPIIQKKKSNKVYWAAAAMLFVILIGTWFFQFSETGKTYGENFSLISIGSTETPSYQVHVSKLVPGQLTYTEALDRDWEAGLVPFDLEGEKTNAWLDARTEESPELAIDNTYVKQAERSQGLRFHVMGGCFSQYENAIKLVNQLKGNGYNALLLGDYKNLHAVSYASFASREEAVKLLEQVKNSHNSKAWLLEKSF